MKIGYSLYILWPKHQILIWIVAYGYVVGKLLVVDFTVHCLRSGLISEETGNWIKRNALHWVNYQNALNSGYSCVLKAVIREFVNGLVSVSVEE